MSSKPPWLDDEPDIRAALNTFLDRLDSKSSEQRSLPVQLPVNAKTFPALFRHDEAADRLWALLKSLEGRVIEIVPDRKRDRLAAEFEGARLRLIPKAEALLRTWFERPLRVPYRESWGAAVTHYAGRFAGGGAALLERTMELPGKSAEEVVAAFASIDEVRKEGLTLRQLAARCFWGHSKCLDSREDLVHRLFPELVLRTRPVLVHVHLPSGFQNVLFVENQDTYLQLVADAFSWPSTALVYVAGYRGSAGRIREAEAASLHFHQNSDHAAQSTFVRWWSGDYDAALPVGFWGDLDYAGFGILKALRRRFGEVRAWQPGYEPMLRLLEKGEGHAGELAAKEEQVDPGATGCPYADSVLLPAIRRHRTFIDQEAVQAISEKPGKSKQASSL